MTLEKTIFSEHLQNFEQSLKQLFRAQYDIDQLSLERGLPKDLLKGIMDLQPLSVAIPEAYDGRGSQVKECLGILAAASYESLPLSLTFGINIALFLEPIAKYGHESIKKGVFDRFLYQQNMGGLMITEPDYGSDALNMRTTNEAVNGGYHIKGVKHWQGLTGMADYWLIASRSKNSEGNLGRDIDFFLCDVTAPGQHINVTELYDNAGLYMIPYGRNELDIKVPEEYRLNPESTGIKMMLDILHRSRMQFPGMGMGFIKRMLDEAMLHCQNRVVGSSNLLALDNVQFQLSKIQAAYTICSGMCLRSSKISGIEHNLATEGLEANTMKAVVTDLMQESAHTLVQLSGANGYRISHIGGRGIMDSRPFQIFEGSNEMLYAQISEMVTRLMKKQKQNDLFDFLKGFEPTSSGVDYFKSDLSFNLNDNLPQRKQVELGRIIARVICAGYVLALQEQGFNKALTESCIVMIRQEISSLSCALKFDNTVQVVTNYAADSSWLNFA